MNSEALTNNGGDKKYNSSDCCIFATFRFTNNVI